ncbi:MAG TPA: sensor domain-containing protein [Candidatus Limnocylindrales bacterium]|nr:sensor domain-containing protein [Candidatus Limnocylindrales bacterium]
MIGAPFLVLGVLVTLSALVGARVAGHRRGAVLDFVLSPLHPATWGALAALLVGFWVELIAFAAVVTLLSGGASLLVAGLGFVLVGVAIEGSRIVARVERARAGWADERPLHPHAYRPTGPGLRELVIGTFLDVARWRDVVYVLVAFPLAVLEAVVAVTLWALALAFLSVPIWWLVGELPPGLSTVLAGSIPGSAATEAVLRLVPSGAALVAIIGGIGLLLTPVAATVSRGLMALHRAVVAGLLCVSDQRALEARVATLETSRRAVLDVEASDLRRIERDLHDGAQQRLVMLSMNLGMAADRIDTDPAAAKALVEDARDQARQALAEIRDLVRGIAPAILLDRGLVPALSALAGRGPIPVVVSSELPERLRLPDPVERAAYFVVAEAVANAAKHASGSAARVGILCRLEAGNLVVEVDDDGPGGARIVPGGGLAGLVGRVEALDGTLTVESPDGGPTIVRATIPTGVAVAPTPALQSAAALPPSVQEPR